MNTPKTTTEALVMDRGEVARALKIGPRLVDVLIARGELPAFKIGDRKTFVRREAVERYLAEREAAAGKVA
jgi:excisionase family DNA binding protein